MHYKRLQKNGTTDLVGRAYGIRTDRQRSQRAGHARWNRIREKFGAVGWLSKKQFLADVGARPAAGMRLDRVDATQPIGPDNFAWVQNRPRGQFDRSSAEGRSAYLASLRAADPTYDQRNNLRKFFGIPLEQYQRMLVEQHGVCASCEQPETATRNGRLLALAVDHCHSTGVIRGLLCANCNRALGLMRDNPAILRRAADYIEKHARPGATVVAFIKKEAVS